MNPFYSQSPVYRADVRSQLKIKCIFPYNTVDFPRVFTKIS